MNIENNKTNWMWLPGHKEAWNIEPVFAYFRRELVLIQVPASYNIKITADSRYKLYVNGIFVEAGPSKGNDKVWYYDEMDISRFLVEGKNVIAVLVLHYPTEHWKGNCSVFRTETPGLYLEEQGCEKTADKWKCKEAEGIKIVSENPYFAPLQIYEEVQGSAEKTDWMTADCNTEGWEEAVYYQKQELTPILSPERLVKRTIPFMKRTPGKIVHRGGQILKAAAHSKRSVDLSAGELKTAYLKLKIAGGSGAKISILQAECYAGSIKVKENDPYGSLPQKGSRTDETLDLYGYTDIYHVTGYGTSEQPEIYEPFWFRTFRFIRLTIETADEPVQVLLPEYEEVTYPLEVLSHAETPDPEMKQIWDICERSLRLCMHETYEDCPFYEQLQYAMDARSQILYTYAVSADPRLALKCMDDFRCSARKDGMLNCSYPNYEENVIPGFSIFYIGMVYDYMMYFGKKDEIQKHMETIDGILQYFQDHLDERGIVGKIGDLNRPGNDWSFIDWTPEWDETNGVPCCTLQGPVTMESLYYLLGLQYAADIAEYMGEKDKVLKYSGYAEHLSQAVQAYCVGENGMYQDGPGIEEYSQHSQVFAVLTGLASKETGRKLLIETLTHKERYAQCSVASMFYLFRALEKCDIYEYTKDLWNIWKDMLKNNMTTCAEDTLMSRSDCHAWGALALYELPAAVLGVKPVKPGFAEMEVKPQKNYYKWAKGEAVTPKGMIKVEW